MSTKTNGFIVLSWLAVALGVLSYILTSFLPVGFGIAAVILSLIALLGLKGETGKKKYVAWAGLIIGGSKLLIIIGMALWIIIAFSLNPVAH